MKAIYRNYKDNIVINRFVNLLSVDVLVKGSSFLLLPVYLKLMTQVEFGFYNYLISIVTFFSQVLNFGLYVAQSKIYPELKAEDRGSFLFTLQISLLLLLASALVVIYAFGLDFKIIELLFKSPINYAHYRFPILIAIVSAVYSFMLYNYFLTSERIKHVQRYNVLRLICVHGISLTGLLLIKGDGVFTRISLTYAVEIILVVCFFYYYVKEMKADFNKNHFIRGIKLGFPVMASSVLGIFMSFGDKYLLEKKSGFVDLSIYYLAFSIANVIPLVFNTFQNIWLPIFFKERNLQENLRKTKKMIFRLFFAFLGLSIMMLLGMKGALLFNLIDAKYNTVIFILPLVLLAVSVDSISHLLINYVTYFEQTYILPVLSVFLGASSITLNIFAIKYYGIYGAAVSLLTISSLGFLTYFILLKVNLSRINSANNSN